MLLMFKGKNKFSRAKRGKFKKKGRGGSSASKSSYRSSTGAKGLSQFNYAGKSSSTSVNKSFSGSSRNIGAATVTATRKPGFLGAPGAKRSFLSNVGTFMG